MARTRRRSRAVAAERKGIPADIAQWLRNGRPEIHSQTEGDLFWKVFTAEGDILNLGIATDLAWLAMARKLDKFEVCEPAPASHRLDPLRFFEKDEISKLQAETTRRNEAQLANEIAHIGGEK